MKTRYLLLSLVMFASLQMYGSDEKPWVVTFTRLRDNYPTFRQVVDKVSLAALGAENSTEILRLVENYGWGMRVITIGKNNAVAGKWTIQVSQVRPGAPDNVYTYERAFSYSDIATEIQTIRKTEALNTQMKLKEPPVIDGGSFLIEFKTDSEYRWFFRNGFADDIESGGGDALRAFSMLEKKTEGEVNSTRGSEPHKPAKAR